MPDFGPNEAMITSIPIRKADAALATLVADGGYISEKELPEFLQQAILEAELSKTIRRVLMPSKEFEIPRLRFPQGSTDYILYPLRENEAALVAERSAPDFAGLNLQAYGFGGQVTISDQILLSNVERAALVETIRSMLFPQIGADMEKIGIRGDTTSAIPSLAVMNGWIALATAHAVAAAGNRLSDDLLEEAARALPEEYDKGLVEYDGSKRAQRDWWDALKARATGLGDISLIENKVINYRGDPVKRFPLWPNDMGGTSDRTTILYTEPKNYVQGIFNEVRLEVGRELINRQVVFVFDVWMAIGYEVDDAVVAINDVLNS